MKALVLSVLLTLMQTLPPVVGQTADTGAGKRQAVQKQAKQDSQPAAEVGTPNKPNTPRIPEDKKASSGEVQADSKGQHDTKQTVTISKPVPVSVERDWIDYATLFLSLGLVIVGAWAVVAARRPPHVARY